MMPDFLKKNIIKVCFVSSLLLGSFKENLQAPSFNPNRFLKILGRLAAGGTFCTGIILVTGSACEKYKQLKFKSVDQIYRYGHTNANQAVDDILANMGSLTQKYLCIQDPEYYHVFKGSYSDLLNKPEVRRALLQNNTEIFCSAISSAAVEEMCVVLNEKHALFRNAEYIKQVYYDYCDYVFNYEPLRENLTNIKELFVEYCDSGRIKDINPLYKLLKENKFSEFFSKNDVSVLG